ncbi:MAG: ABC transporter ATP-binding protein [Sphingomicrobium sp.]
MIALVGPNGGGKTSLLRALARVEEARGIVLIDGADIDQLGEARRSRLISFLPASREVAWPIAVRDIVALGGADHDQLNHWLAAFGLLPFADRMIGNLSTGERARALLARAMATGPRLLLLDEPLSNLDPTLRERTRRELAATLKRIGITTLLVTHEQEEAFDLGDRVALLNAGRLEQLGTPHELYRAPATRFVAGFIGRDSFLPVVVQEIGPAKEDGLFPTAVSGPALAPGAKLSLAQRGFGKGEKADLWLRPEMLELATAEESSPSFTGSLVAIRFSGAMSYLTVRLKSGQEIEAMCADEVPPLDSTVALCLRAGARPMLFPSHGAAESSA